MPEFPERLCEVWKEQPAKLGQKNHAPRWTVKFPKAKVDVERKLYKRDIAVPALRERMDQMEYRSTMCGA